MIKSIEIGGWMSLINTEQYNALVQNGLSSDEKHDEIPIVYLVSDRMKCLISEICQDNPDEAYALYSSGNDVQFGRVSLSRLQNSPAYVQNIPFETHYSVQVFRKVAEELGQIVTDDNLYFDIFAKYQPK